MENIIYHNPRCSKSRATLDLLKEKGLSIKIINYLENPPSREELKVVLKRLDKRPQELIRFKEAVAKELKLSNKDVRDFDEWVGLMVDNPVLIERPIVVIGDKAAIGRPPEKVLSII